MLYTTMTHTPINLIIANSHNISHSCSVMKVRNSSGTFDRKGRSRWQLLLLFEELSIVERLFVLLHPLVHGILHQGCDLLQTVWRYFDTVTWCWTAEGTKVLIWLEVLMMSTGQVPSERPGGQLAPQVAGWRDGNSFTTMKTPKKKRQKAQSHFRFHGTAVFWKGPQQNRSHIFTHTLIHTHALLPVSVPRCGP